MRVLVADEFPKHHLESLRGLGVSVDYRPELKAEELPEATKEASILVVRSTEVNERVFQQASALSLKHVVRPTHLGSIVSYSSRG